MGTAGRHVVSGVLRDAVSERPILLGHVNEVHHYAALAPGSNHPAAARLENWRTVVAGAGRFPSRLGVPECVNQGHCPRVRCNPCSGVSQFGISPLVSGKQLLAARRLARFIWALTSHCVARPGEVKCALWISMCLRYRLPRRVRLPRSRPDQNAARSNCNSSDARRSPSSNELVDGFQSSTISHCATRPARRQRTGAKFASK